MAVTWVSAVLFVSYLNNISKNKVCQELFAINLQTIYIFYVDRLKKLCYVYCNFNRKENNKMENKIAVRNIPDHQYEWVQKQATKNGSNMSVIIKILLQEQVEKEEIKNALKKEYEN